MINIIDPITEFISWHKNNRLTTRLQKHEAMKAFLFRFGEGLLEYPIKQYYQNRNGLIDYVDKDVAIEIDDGSNIKSLRKLDFIRKTENKSVYWILILRTGKGGKAFRLAKEYNITLIRILARNNYEEVLY